MRFCSTLFVLAAVGLAVAAPVPKETEAEKIKRLYGEIVDQDKDCTVSLRGKVLRIRVPDTPHGINLQRGLFNAPRIVKEIEGDFTAVASIRILKPVEGENPPSRFDAGILVMADEKSLVYYARQIDSTRAKPRHSNIHCLIVNGHHSRSGSASGGSFSAETASLRVSRERDKLQLSYSIKPGQWLKSSTIDAKFSDRVKVGIYAGQEGHSAFTAEFENFAITSNPPPD